MCLAWGFFLNHPDRMSSNCKFTCGWVLPVGPRSKGRRGPFFGCVAFCRRSPLRTPSLGNLGFCLLSPAPINQAVNTEAHCHWVWRTAGSKSHLSLGLCWRCSGSRPFLGFRTQQSLYFLASSPMHLTHLTYLVIFNKVGQGSKSSILQEAKCWELTFLHRLKLSYLKTVVYLHIRLGLLLRF